MTVAAYLCLTPHYLHATDLPQVWHVDCSASSRAKDGSTSPTLHTLAEVNQLSLHHGDHVLFLRGTVCRGVLSPQGSGSTDNPIHIGAFGHGPRPRIEATASDEAALQLRDQQYWEIESLDISGSRTYGVHITATHNIVHNILLRDLTVHRVGIDTDSVSKKSSGLVVIHAEGSGAGFDHVLIDGIDAHNTGQWAGIMVEGAEGSGIIRDVIVRNSMVHDVQGDGIILFRLSDGLIENSIAWHTGMQDTEHIGTPNAIWTWACTRCVVQNNEAFLTDSPGIDAGAFDIDFWNTDNVVRNNYGHDTQGYCVSIFGANSITRHSKVSGNLCVHNGLSPRLAARQGAIFLMTWYGGSIEDVLVDHNTIYFQPPGNVAAIQRGSDLKISGLVIENNSLTSTTDVAAAPGLPWDGHGNTFVHGEFPTGLAIATPTSTLPGWALDRTPHSHSSDWQLIVTMPEIKGADIPRPAVGQLMLLRSQSLQFRKAGLRVTVACPCAKEQIDQLKADWQLADSGITVMNAAKDSPASQTTVLIDPQGGVRKTWQGALTPIDLGMALRQALGNPQFAGLPLN